MAKVIFHKPKSFDRVKKDRKRKGKKRKSNQLVSSQSSLKIKNNKNCGC